VAVCRGLSAAARARIASEIAVGLEQLDRGLVANALHAGNVVGGVADEREIVDDALGRYAEPLARIGLIHPLLLHGRLPTTARVEERDAVADQLIEILVAETMTACKPSRAARSASVATTSSAS